MASEPHEPTSAPEPPRRRRGRPPRDPDTPRHDPGVLGGRAAEQFSRAILDSLTSLVAVIEHDGRIVAVNKAWQGFALEVADEFPAVPGLGDNYLDAIEDGSSFERAARDEAAAGVRDVLDRRRARFTLEYAMPAGGGRRHFLLVVTPLLGVEGGAVIAHRETTELMQARDEAVDQQRMLRAVLEGSADGVVVADRSGEFVVFNRAAREIAGVGLIQGSPETWSANFGIFHPDRETLFRLEELPLYRAIQGESTDRLRMFLKNPAIPEGRFIEISGRPWTTPDGTARGGVVVFSDITAQVIAEEHSTLQIGVLDSIPLAILALDERGHVTYWNHAAEQLTGWGAADLVGRRGRDVLLDEPRREQVESILAYVRSDRPYRGEFRVRRPDGTATAVLATVRARRDAAGAVVGYVVVGVDLTDAQLTRDVHDAREYELRQFQKMEAIGRLAGGVAHDFNNLLTVIRGFTDIARHKAAGDDSLRGDIDQISRAVDRAAELTAQLLAFGRRQPLEPTLLDLNQVVSDCMPMLRRTLGEDIRVRVDLDPELGLARADAGQIGQVLLNIVLNARDAMPDGGELQVTTRAMEFDPAFPGDHPTLPAGAYVELAVRDTGVGMDEDLRARVFEPFFTTKEPDRGSGLGLSTAYGIIRQLGGQISVQSVAGLGATFRVHLPRVFAPAGPPPAPAAPPRTAARPATLLLVEDDPAVRAIERRLLQLGGHLVLEAHDADSALAVAASFAGPIDLVICDVGLPGRDGPEVVAALRAARPGLRALFVSGHGPGAANRRGPGDDEPYLPKPFSAAELDDAVGRALSGGLPTTPPRSRTPPPETR